MTLGGGGGGTGGRQRAGEDGLDLGDVEGRMHTEGWGKSHGTGVNGSLNLEWTNETGGEFGGELPSREGLLPEAELFVRERTGGDR